MNVLLFGATGMVGQGVLRACLGVSSGGLTEADYTCLTHDVTLAAA